jgi:hypothetical protein
MTFTKWLLGIVTIVLFPFTLVILTLYAVFIRIPHWLGGMMLEWFDELRKKLNENNTRTRD